MIIGVVGCFYAFSDTIDNVLKPWIQFKKKSNHTLVIASVHCQFKEYSEMGDKCNDKKTNDKLSCNKDIDFHFNSTKPLSESEARNIPLRFLLEKKVDMKKCCSMVIIYSLKLQRMTQKSKISRNIVIM